MSTTTSILRASRRSSLKPLSSPKSPRSILKRRPTSLALTPLALALPFSHCSSILSPFPSSPNSPQTNLTQPTSPHVHFPPTPSLSSTFITHSAATYDRAPIKVPPNPLELPPRGDRTYNISSFADSISSGIIQGVVPVDIPPTAFDPPMSDTDIPIEALNCKSPPPVFHRFVRFATLPPHSPLPNIQSGSINQSATSARSMGSPYPRSPYPAAPSPPLTPAEDKENTPPPTSPRTSPNTSKTQAKKPRRIVAWKGHGELKLSDLFAAPSISSPLRQSHLSPVAESPSPSLPAPHPTNAVTIKTSAKPPPLDLHSGSESDTSNPSSQLSKAFWKSVSLVDLHDEHEFEHAAAVSACAYPSSAVELQDTLTANEDGVSMASARLSVMSPIPLSAAPLSAIPDLVLGRKPETLWSPGLPRRRPSQLDVPEEVTPDLTRDTYLESDTVGNAEMNMTVSGDEYGDMVDLSSILSPGANHQAQFSLNPPPRSTVAAPSPNDPFAAFPSFSAVLHLHGAGAGAGVGVGTSVGTSGAGMEEGMEEGMKDIGQKTDVELD